MRLMMLTNDVWDLRVVVGIVLLLVLGAAPVQGQSAGERFHEAAQYYIAEDRSAARRVVDAALETYPNDPRLQALKEKLEQSGPEPQPDSGQGQGGESKQSGDEGQTSPQSQGNPTQDGETQDGSEQRQDDPSGEQPSQRPGEQERQGQDGPPNRPPQSQDGAEGAEGRPGEGQGDASKGKPSERMSRAQAEQILKALEGQELQLLREVQKQSSRPVQVEKDW